ncbi:MAG: hypothetical protein WC148_01190 [Bacilli bacterium]|jgi:hypothetical protein
MINKYDDKVEIRLTVLEEHADEAFVKLLNNIFDVVKEFNIDVNDKTRAKIELDIANYVVTDFYCYFVKNYKELLDYFYEAETRNLYDVHFRKYCTDKEFIKLSYLINDEMMATYLLKEKFDFTTNNLFKSFDFKNEKEKELLNLKLCLVTRLIYRLDGYNHITIDSLLDGSMEIRNIEPMILKDLTLSIYKAFDAMNEETSLALDELKDIKTTIFVKNRD